LRIGHFCCPSGLARGACFFGAVPGVTHRRRRECRQSDSSGSPQPMSFVQNRGVLAMRERCADCGWGWRQAI
jgi:hypothetical protein